MTIQIPVLFCVEWGSIGFRLDDGDVPAPDERCFLSPRVVLASPDCSEGYQLGPVVAHYYPSPDYTAVLTGQALVAARAFLTEFHRETLDAEAERMAARASERLAT